MKFIFTEHIKDRLIQRGISQKEVISVIMRPDKIAEGVLGKKIAIKKGLKVVYIEEGDKVILITAYRY